MRAIDNLRVQRRRTQDLNPPPPSPPTDLKHIEHRISQIEATLREIAPAGHAQIKRIEDLLSQIDAMMKEHINDKPKALPPSPLVQKPPSLTPASTTDAELQISHAPVPYSGMPPLPHSPRLQKIKETLNMLTITCVACWATGRRLEYEHNIDDCPLQIGNYYDNKWKAWRRTLHFTPTCCIGCGVDKKVC
jgi:hypothetical protein